MMIARPSSIAFASAERELAFYDGYFVAQRPTVQTALLIGGLIMYPFSVWDTIIDPAHYD